MKIIIKLILLFIMMSLTHLQPILADNASNNEIIGEVLSTNIRTYIDRMDIDSYNINGNTYIIVEELDNYGFDVKWNENDRTLTIKRNTSKIAAITNIEYIKKNFSWNAINQKIGAKVFDAYRTDIKTYADGTLVNTFNINGRTVVQVDELMKYGQVKWYEATRQIYVSIIEYNLNKEFDEATNKQLFTKEILETDTDYYGILSDSGVYYNEYTYTGQMKDGNPNGIGKIKLGSGYKYTEYLGNFENGHLNGVAVKVRESVSGMTSNCYIAIGKYSDGVINSGYEVATNVKYIYVMYPYSVGEYQNGKIKNGVICKVDFSLSGAPFMIFSVENFEEKLIFTESHG